MIAAAASPSSRTVSAISASDPNCIWFEKPRSSGGVFYCPDHPFLKIQKIPDKAGILERIPKSVKRFSETMRVKTKD
ncbi:hypothetical protein GHC20_05780 [Brucella sp. 2280]|nr:hypothetical protein GHC20_05780 [Brucella sp. 2280]